MTHGSGGIPQKSPQEIANMMENLRLEKNIVWNNNTNDVAKKFDKGFFGRLAARIWSFVNPGNLIWGRSARVNCVKYCKESLEKLQDEIKQVHLEYEAAKREELSGELLLKKIQDLNTSFEGTQTKETAYKVAVGASRRFMEKIKRIESDERVQEREQLNEFIVTTKKIWELESENEQSGPSLDKIFTKEENEIRNLRIIALNVENLANSEDVTKKLDKILKKLNTVPGDFYGFENFGEATASKIRNYFLNRPIPEPWKDTLVSIAGRLNVRREDVGLPPLTEEIAKETTSILDQIFGTGEKSETQIKEDLPHENLLQEVLPSPAPGDFLDTAVETIEAAVDTAVDTAVGFFNKMIDIVQETFAPAPGELLPPSYGEVVEILSQLEPDPEITSCLEELKKQEPTTEWLRERGHELTQIAESIKDHQPANAARLEIFATTLHAESKAAELIRNLEQMGDPIKSVLHDVDISGKRTLNESAEACLSTVVTMLGQKMGGSMEQIDLQHGQLSELIDRVSFLASGWNGGAPPYVENGLNELKAMASTLQLRSQLLDLDSLIMQTTGAPRKPIQLKESLPPTAEKRSPINHERATEVLTELVNISKHHIIFGKDDKKSDEKTNENIRKNLLKPCLKRVQKRPEPLTKDWCEETTKDLQAIFAATKFNYKEKNILEGDLKRYVNRLNQEIALLNLEEELLSFWDVALSKNVNVTQRLNTITDTLLSRLQEHSLKTPKDRQEYREKLDGVLTILANWKADRDMIVPFAITTTISTLQDLREQMNLLVNIHQIDPALLPESGFTNPESGLLSSLENIEKRFVEALPQEASAAGARLELFDRVIKELIKSANKMHRPPPSLIKSIQRFSEQEQQFKKQMLHSTDEKMKAIIGQHNLQEAASLEEMNQLNRSVLNKLMDTLLQPPHNFSPATLRTRVALMHEVCRNFETVEGCNIAPLKGGIALFEAAIQVVEFLDHDTLAIPERLKALKDIDNAAAQETAEAIITSTLEKEIAAVQTSLQTVSPSEITTLFNHGKRVTELKTTLMQAEEFTTKSENDKWVAQLDEMRQNISNTLVPFIVQRANREFTQGLAELDDLSRIGIPIPDETVQEIINHHYQTQPLSVEKQSALDSCSQKNLFRRVIDPFRAQYDQALTLTYKIENAMNDRSDKAIEEINEALNDFHNNPEAYPKPTQLAIREKLTESMDKILDHPGDNLDELMKTQSFLENLIELPLIHNYTDILAKGTSLESGIEKGEELFIDLKSKETQMKRSENPAEKVVYARQICEAAVNNAKMFSEFKLHDFFNKSFAPVVMESLEVLKSSLNTVAPSEEKVKNAKLYLETHHTVVGEEQDVNAWLQQTKNNMVKNQRQVESKLRKEREALNSLTKTQENFNNAFREIESVYNNAKDDKNQLLGGIPLPIQPEDSTDFPSATVLLNPQVKTFCEEQLKLYTGSMQADHEEMGRLRTEQNALTSQQKSLERGKDIALMINGLALEGDLKTDPQTLTDIKNWEAKYAEELEKWESQQSFIARGKKAMMEAKIALNLEDINTTITQDLTSKKENEIKALKEFYGTPPPQLDSIALIIDTLNRSQIEENQRKEKLLEVHNKLEETEKNLNNAILKADDNAAACRRFNSFLQAVELTNQNKDAIQRYEVGSKGLQKKMDKAKASISELEIELKVLEKTLSMME